MLAQLDLVQAKRQLGQDMMESYYWNSTTTTPSLVIPTVRDEGVFHVDQAKYPVLLLRNLPHVVSNDLSLGQDNHHSGLILTGPNSGGKTIILKLIGLFALMV